MFVLLRLDATTGVEYLSREGRASRQGNKESQTFQNRNTGLHATGNTEGFQVQRQETVEAVFKAKTRKRVVLRTRRARLESMVLNTLKQTLIQAKDSTCALEMYDWFFLKVTAEGNYLQHIQCAVNSGNVTDCVLANRLKSSVHRFYSFLLNLYFLVGE